MKKTITLTAVIVMLLFLTDCRKITRVTDVSGTVYDAVTMAPLANIKVFLLTQAEGALGAGASPVMDISTDHDGHYSFKFKADRNYMYSLLATDSRHLSGQAAMDNFKDNKNVNIKLNPAAYIKLHLKNTSPFDANDLLVVKNSYALYYGLSLTGMATDTILLLQEPGNDNTLIHWSVKKNGITTYDDSTMYCAGFDTTLLDINY